MPLDKGDVEWRARTDKIWRELAKQDVTRPSAFEGNEFFVKLVATESASTLDDCCQWVSKCGTGDWRFRGQADVAWLLLSSLDRQAMAEEKKSDEQYCGKPLGWKPAQGDEKGMERHFWRKNIMEKLARGCSDEDILSHISDCQHNELFTPFVDFTKCAEIAAFFALRGNEGKSAAVWAVDMDWVKSFESKESSYSERTDEYQSDSTFRVRFIDPRRPNPKLESQKGCFLALVNHEGHFKEGLVRMICQTRPIEPIIRKLAIGSCLHDDIRAILEARGIDEISLGLKRN